jgi:hypothetical protein
MAEFTDFRWDILLPTSKWKNNPSSNQEGSGVGKGVTRVESWAEV